MAAAGFRNRNDLRLSPRIFQNAIANQAVMQDDVGIFQRAHRLQGQKIRIARTGTDEDDATGRWTVLRRTRQTLRNQLTPTLFIAREDGIGCGA